MSVEVSPLIDVRTLLDIAQMNYGTTLRHVTDLTHEESLIQPPFNSNCLNWVMGHMLQSRDKMLQLVDAPSVWTPEQIARYDRGSEPITGEGDVMRFETILADFQSA